MADSFYVGPTGRIIRDPGSAGPSTATSQPVRNIDLSNADKSRIMARSLTDPIKRALCEDLYDAYSKRPGGYVPKALVSVHVGNSLSQNAFFGTVNSHTGFDRRSEVNFANHLHPLCMWKRTTTASSFVDLYGNYGNPGQPLSAILPLLPAWASAIKASGILPGIVHGTALVENDIALGGVTSDGILKMVDAFVQLMRDEFPGVIVHLSTNHPDARLTTQAQKAVWYQVRAGIMGLHNGSDLFVTDLSQVGGTSDLKDPTIPADGMTSDGLIHVNATGASRNGRMMAKTFRQISARLALAGPYSSPNPGMFGTQGSNIQGYTGTMPVPWPAAVIVAEVGEVQMAVSNPGAWNIDYHPINYGNGILFQGQMNTGLPASSSAGYIKVRLNSGSSNVHYITCDQQLVGTPGVPESYSLQDPGSDYYEFQDGDVLYLQTVAVANPSTTFTISAQNLTVHANTMTNAGGSPINLDVLAFGWIDTSAF